MYDGKLYLGVDGGGTGCRALLCDECGTALGVGMAGSANLMTNLKSASQNLMIAIQQAFEQAELELDTSKKTRAVMGLAGANIGNFADQLKASLPFSSCLITTDAEISLEGAVGPNDGVAAIIGTGSVFSYRRNGKFHTVGGWGFMVGDLASGAWLGRYLLQETLLSFDGIHGGSALTRKILDDFRNNPQTVVEYAHTARPGEFGQLAPLIFEFADRRDPIARRILSKAIAAIEETLDVILPDDNSRFCMIGGLGPTYANLLSSYYRERVREPIANAATGAAQMAIRKSAGQVS